MSFEAIEGNVEWLSTLQGGREAVDARWKTGYAVLSDTQLTLFEDARKERTVYVLPLAIAGVEPNHAPVDGRKYSFQLGDTMEKVVISAPSEAEVNHWVVHIQNAATTCALKSLEHLSIFASDNAVVPKPTEMKSPPSRTHSKTKKLAIFQTSQYSFETAENDTDKSDGEDTMFGQELQEQCDREDKDVPGVVTKCIEYVTKNGLDVEGVYRLSGNSAGVKALKKKLAKANIKFVSIEPVESVHVVTGLLKQYFRELKQPLCTFALYTDFINAGRIKDETQRRNAVREVVRRLPEAHFHTFKVLSEHLKEVASHSDQNKMLMVNLAIVFGPTLFRDESGNMACMINDTPVQACIVDMLAKDSAWFFQDFVSKTDMSY